MIQEFIKEIVKIDSPSGYTDNAINHLKEKYSQMGYKTKFTNKKALFVSANDNVKFALSSHVDTLGAMVKNIKSDGTIKITQIGRFPNNSFEGEYIRIITRDKKIITGTFLLNNPSSHVNKDVAKTERTEDNMSIRLDAEVKSASDTENLGIEIGNYIFFNPRYEYTETGFVKTRFLDDKACVGIFMDILSNHKDLIEKHSVGFYFSNYEEVGHGAAYGIPESVEELLMADMGVVGEDVKGDEYSVSICPKDSIGPYDYDLTNELVSIAKEKKINYKIDVFPYYGSDGSAALSAGCGFRVALIGPGVSASHGVERTHIKALNATKELIMEIIQRR